MDEKEFIFESILDLLRDCYEDNIQHLKLKRIRDRQEPKFFELKEEFPEIYEDFMEARTGPHEILLENRASSPPRLSSNLGVI